MPPSQHNTDTDQSSREVIEVEVERLGVQPTRRELASKRFMEILKPVALGAMVDLCDLFTFAPFSPFFLVLGMIVGYLFAKWLDAPPTWRIVISGIVGVYWVIPLTGPIPLAAAIAAFVYIFKPEVMRRDPILDRGRSSG